MVYTYGHQKGGAWCCQSMLARPDHLKLKQPSMFKSVILLHGESLEGNVAMLPGVTLLAGFNSRRAAGVSMHSQLAPVEAPEGCSNPGTRVMPTYLQGGWGSVQWDRRTLAALQACRSWIGLGWVWPCSTGRCAAGAQLQYLTACTQSCLVCCCLHAIVAYLSSVMKPRTATRASCTRGLI